MSAISLSTSEIDVNWGEPDKAPAFSKQRLVVWKQLQTNFFFPPLYIFLGLFPTDSQLDAAATPQFLGLQRQSDRWLHLGVFFFCFFPVQMATPQTTSSSTGKEAKRP